MFSGGVEDDEARLLMEDEAFGRVNLRLFINLDWRVREMGSVRKLDVVQGVQVT